MKHVTLMFFFLFTCHNVLAQVNSADSKPQKTIVIYGSDTCHYCTDTKTFLEEKKIKFVFYDVDLNLDKQKEMLNKLVKANIDISSLSLPVIDKKGEIFTNEPDFEAFLKRIIQ